MRISVNEYVISREARRNVQEALRTNWISSSGPFVLKFEADIARYLGMRHAIAVTSGTAALHVALLALGIKKGDEVIVPAFTMAATWMAVMYTGAKPVFVDCERETYNIDISKIERAITARTRAIIPVHIYGHACEMNEIMRIAKRHKLAVLEDAAEVLGGEYRGKRCGSMGDINIFSFYANKIVTCGEGGMIVTNDAVLAGRARKFRDLCHSEKKRFIHDGLGYNYRMTNLQAAVGVGELQNIKTYLKRKQAMAARYHKGLSSIPGIRLPVTQRRVLNTYWMYAIVIDEKKFGMSRDTFREELKKQGVDSRDFFYAPEEQPVLKKIIGKQKFPNTKYLSEHGLYLPSGLAITSAQIAHVCKKIKSNSIVIKKIS